MNPSITELLSLDGPVALTIRESLVSAYGKDAPVFPPTFAPEEGSDEKPSYNIDSVGQEKIALMDSVGAQSNRIEPLFKQPPYRQLVPTVRIQVGARKIDLLDAGHRAADAIVRYSSAWAKFQQAFESYRDTGNAAPLAKLAPTSIVFGVWDSRETQVKLPRLFESSIRARNVQPLTRSAQYFTSLEKEELESLSLDQKQLSKLGFNDAPAGRMPGGILAEGGIQRHALLNLVALRALSAGEPANTTKLQSYILGLSLIAFTAPTPLFLRQGCLLVADGSPEISTVSRSGERKAFQITPETVLQFASQAAAEFGVGEDLETTFEGEKAAKSEPKPKKPAK